MDRQQIANATSAWVEVWLHGNARPQTVLDALRRLGAQSAADAQAHVILERAWRVVTATPFGSVSESIAFGRTQKPQVMDSRRRANTYGEYASLEMLTPTLHRTIGTWRD